MTEFRPRPSQEKILAYTGGKMGVSAVPGSGKTRTLAELAAKLVAEAIDDGQEVLVVTLVNSAVNHFKTRINESIKKRDLLPNFGYRVRTLHGLAHDIVRERPGLVGLSEDYGIMDEREADVVREEAVEAWLRAHPDAADPYLAPDVEGDRAVWVKRTQWPALAGEVTAAFIKQAKDLQLTPEVLLERLASLEAQAILDRPGLKARQLSLARMGAEIYADYQRSLAYRGTVDFDDLIRLALEALSRDADYLARLQQRWPYVLEDEAQDSSRLQEKILRKLAGESGNWVRVGDPNQAIYETFTTADPQLLLDFVGEEEEVASRKLPESGRSQPAIIELANRLIAWVQDEHPRPEVRRALVEPHIVPTPPGDPQPNPPRDPRGVELMDRRFTPEGELSAVADHLGRWLPDHRDRTAAVLVPRNLRGFQLIEPLKQRQIPYVELLRSSSATRQTAGVLGNLLRCLADPASAHKLSTAFQVWRRQDRDAPDATALMETVARRIRGCQAVEAYLWPRADHDWLAPLTDALSDGELQLLTDFREKARLWHRAANLPIDQLILTLAGDLFREPAELALAYKLALVLRAVAQGHPSYRLPELVEELAVIARNERRFLGFAREDTEFEAPVGAVTVATMHRAKGLEWDRVYLMSVNNYNFPAGQSHDTYIAERWFIRDNLNLEAEVLAQLEALADTQHPLPDTQPPAAVDKSDVGHAMWKDEGEATQQARLDYVAERLRLLYVGITRAKRDLIVTWNTGRRQGASLQAATALIALDDYLKKKDEESKVND